ncbi:AsnC family transcriptional regulator [Microbacterium gorillae]|uniref:AsnC family transcriptional regulator n=1 Tax=Microbacterium gorillae TaxID=1231063 RepID=UPI00059181AC|nr:AsnC family transcriptional regulator [Microbacterium gorillae]
MDDVDHGIVAALRQNPLMSLRELGETTGTSARTAQRRLEALRVSGAVRVVARVHPSFEGRSAWIVRLGAEPRHADAMAAALAAWPRARWVRTARDGGEITAGVLSAARSRESILATLPPDIPVNDYRAAQMLTVWNEEARLTVPRPPRPLDELDRRLIQLLGIDGRAEAPALAAKLGVDASTVLRRRHRLADEQVIAYVVDADPDLFDGHIDALLWVRVAPRSVRRLGERLGAHPQCRMATATSGDWNLLVSIVVNSNEELLDFVVRELDDPDVRDVEIVPGGRTHKRFSA